MQFPPSGPNTESGGVHDGLASVWYQPPTDDAVSNPPSKHREMPMRIGREELLLVATFSLPYGDSIEPLKDVR